MDLPYIVSFGENGMLAISLRAAWVKADRLGRPLLLPPAVRALDRLRAVFTAREILTPGFIISLREALGLTQEQFGRKLGVTKMTVSRWECGRMRPGSLMVAAIRRVQGQARRKGVRIDGEIAGHAK
ncbi:MAG: helix-turn-helix domain-containing protein [Planctomycetota bacterium]|nr:helix-turn-helix domain-containing protein [Planctomycetota bacterium]